jgi:fatty-acyl-CoA synthase
MVDATKSLFANLAARAGDAATKPAFTFVSRDRSASTYSFGTLFEKVHVIRAALGRHRLRERTPVGILLDAQEAQVLHYLAALSIGLIPAILTPPNRKMSRDYYLQSLQAVLEYCGFSALITDMPELAAAIPVLEPYSLRRCGAASPHTSDSLSEAAFLQFSSGTTGIKRGVIVSEAAVLAQIAVYGDAIGLTSDDRIVSWLPLYHDMGFIACLNLPLAYGAHVIMMQPMDWVADPVLYLETIDRFRGTLGWNPNFAYSFMADRVDRQTIAGLDLASLRGLVNCSEPVTYASQQRFLRQFASLGLREDVFWGCYAMAETTFAVTHGTSRDPGYLDHGGPASGSVRSSAAPNVAVGKALPGIEIVVVGQAGLPCRERDIGELWIRSPFNLTGYHNNAEETSRALSGVWYRTGDLGYRVGEQLFVCGRSKDMVIVGGANLYPQDIEEEVGKCAGIKAGRVVAFGAFDQGLQTERLVVLAETTGSDSAVSLSAIRQRVHAAFNVTNFEVEVVQPSSLIKSSSGKIARRPNRDRWLAQQTCSEPAAHVRQHHER